MSNVTTLSRQAPRDVPVGLSDRLEWLTWFGKPSLSKLGVGWHCRIEMNTNSTGASFDVKSDYVHATPEEAVAATITRMQAALTALGV